MKIPLILCFFCIHRGLLIRPQGGLSGYHLRSTWCTLGNAVVVLPNMQGFVCSEDSGPGLAVQLVTLCLLKGAVIFVLVWNIYVLCFAFFPPGDIILW